MRTNFDSLKVAANHVLLKRIQSQCRSKGTGTRVTVASAVGGETAHGTWVSTSVPGSPLTLFANPFISFVVFRRNPRNAS